MNHHWTKNVIASRDGSKLYAAVGSNSNVAENGIEKEEGRAAIWDIDLRSGRHRVFASGLRNPVGMTWEPESGALWAALNERDELGGDLVPDYISSVRDSRFLRWPYRRALIEERGNVTRDHAVRLEYCRTASVNITAP